MRSNNKLYALLSVIVLAAALAIGVTSPAEAQFASNNRSVKLRTTAAGNVATPASGYVSVFRDDTYGAFQVKDSGTLVGGIMAGVAVNTLAANTTITAAHLGEFNLYNGAASQTITLPEITPSNIGMQLTIFELDGDDIIVSRAGSADVIVNATTVNATTVTGTTIGAYATFTAVSADMWVMTNIGGTWT